MDFSFAEFGIIGIVALLVIGPDKLPGLARTAGLWVGKVKNFISSVKTEIDAEISMQDIKNSIHSGKSGLHEIREIFHDTVTETRNEFKSSVDSIKNMDSETESAPDYQVKAIADNFDADDEQHNDVEDEFANDYHSDFDIDEIEASTDSADFIATEASFESSDSPESSVKSTTEELNQTVENETNKTAPNKKIPNSKESM